MDGSIESLLKTSRNAYLLPVRSGGKLHAWKDPTIVPAGLGVRAGLGTRSNYPGRPRGLVLLVERRLSQRPQFVEIPSSFLDVAAVDGLLPLLKQRERTSTCTWFARVAGRDRLHVLAFLEMLMERSKDSRCTHAASLLNASPIMPALVQEPCSN